ncbi:hypothetical protein FB451DRAFT_272413 [Mycena latifolia]|nr:hypothetical protein FB451DRAFT_272413 [Mycena latifolia]
MTATTWRSRESRTRRRRMPVSTTGTCRARRTPCRRPPTASPAHYTSLPRPPPTRTRTPNSTARSSARSEVDTEDDAVPPITPLPGSRFDITPPPATKGAPAYPELEGNEGSVDVSVHYPSLCQWRTQQERLRNITVSPRTGGGTGQRMHTTRARNG